MGDEVERFVRGFEAFAARSGQRIVELRASGRGADVCVTATFEKVEMAADERVGAAWCAAAARCAAPDVVNVNSGVRVDARAAGGDAGAHGVRAGKFCRFNEWARPGRLPQRRTRGKRGGAARKRGKRSDAAVERRKRVWVERSCRRTRACNTIIAAVRRRAAQLLVAARETDDGCAGGAAWRRDDKGRLSRVETAATTAAAEATTTGTGMMSYSNKLRNSSFQSNGGVDDGGSSGDDSDETDKSGAVRGGTAAAAEATTTGRVVQHRPRRASPGSPGRPATRG